MSKAGTKIQRPTTAPALTQYEVLKFIKQLNKPKLLMDSVSSAHASFEKPRSFFFSRIQLPQRLFFPFFALRYICTQSRVFSVLGSVFITFLSSAYFFFFISAGAAIKLDYCCTHTCIKVCKDPFSCSEKT